VVFKTAEEILLFESLHFTALKSLAMLV